MGFFNKIKDILFEEVEEDENIKETMEVKVEENKPIAEKIEPPKRIEKVEPVREVPKETVEEPVKKETPIETLNERDLFKSENTFPFPDFDEEEFSNSMSRVQNPRATTNVLEYEKKKKIEKKYDFGRYERIDKTEIVEKKKFRPSPIISPVYGILHEDYKPEDIQDKTEEYSNSQIDFNSVRKKAFGDTEVMPEVEEMPKETYYEETVTVKLKEPEIEQKVKTIDELLEDTADMEISVDEEPIREYDTIDKELEEDLAPVDAKPEKTEAEKVEDDDTLENDLFDLIDSMYDNREDGEY